MKFYQLYVGQKIAPTSIIGVGARFLSQSYSISRPLGFRAGSLDKNPKTNRATKDRTTILTMIFRVSILFFPLKAFKNLRLSYHILILHLYSEREGIALLILILLLLLLLKKRVFSSSAEKPSFLACRVWLWETGEINSINLRLHEKGRPDDATIYLQKGRFAPNATLADPTIPITALKDV